MGSHPPSDDEVILRHLGKGAGLEYLKTRGADRSLQGLGGDEGHRRRYAQKAHDPDEGAQL